MAADPQQVEEILAMLAKYRAISRKAKERGWADAETLAEEAERLEWALAQVLVEDGLAPEVS
jgi:hypothetical protein